VNNLQFRILYREFLFRVVDLELLSSHAQGDASKILGQFAALLILLGTLFALGVLGIGDARTPRAELLIAAWGTEHFLIATTMLVVGLFAVLSWDSTFPDRRDVLILAPLPVRTRTVFLAKVSASATALSLTVLALNGLTSLAWTLATAPADGGILNTFLSPALYRGFAAYAVTIVAASVFIFGFVLCVQGLAALLLSRRLFLRLSAFLQMAAFCLLVIVYFLQPQIATPKAIAASQNQHLLAWLPSYWFLGLLQELNGSMHPALGPLAQMAWLGLAIVGLGTVAVYILSYLRTLRRIVEEPDIVPGSRRGSWLPRFGDAFETAVTQFSLRTLFRSRQHRLILAFYLGAGFAITILFLKTPVAQRHLMAASWGDAWHQVSGALLASSVVMMIAWVVGTRVVFSMPVDLRANWIFRIAPIPGAPACLAARRRALIVLAVAPVGAGSAALLLSIWPWKPAASHILILVVLGIALTEICLHGVQKIPFTCSYLPGRSNFHLSFWLCIGLIMILISKGAEFERRALEDSTRYWSILVVFGIFVVLARWRTTTATRSEGAELQFEDETPPVILGLGLNRDGALTIDPPSSCPPSG
jgi:hypothetical protein